jgi:nucleoid-associated protein YgaU
MHEAPGKSTLHPSSAADASSAGHAATPGKRTLVEAQIMRQAGSTAASHPEGAQRAFRSATSGSASQVPFRAEMERSFGQDFSSVRSHAGAEARPGLDALNANAAAQGESIAFASASPDRALVAHELTHVVQQRQGGGGGVQNKGALSDPGDHAEREADDVAQRVVAGERVSVGTSAASGAIHRDIKEPHAKVPLGEFAINMRKIEGSPGDNVGETGTVSFTANNKAPDSASIRLTQIVKTFDLGTKKDFDWTGSKEANRGKMQTTDKDESYTTTATDTLKSIALQFYGDPARTLEIYDVNKASLKSNKADDVIGVGVALKIPKSVVGGNFVDHLAADPKAKKRGAKTDANVPQDYVWPGEENPPTNRHGSKAGTTIVPASLDDTPAWNRALGYTFETVARSDDNGTYFGTMHWGFKINAAPGKVSDESWHVTEGVSHTFKGALDDFNKFYKNTYTVMVGDTLASIAERYLGSSAKADDVYNANKALIPDKMTLTPGIKLAIPGISPVS